MIVSSDGWARGAHVVRRYSLRLLDVVNPLRDPSLTVAAVLTFIVEVGQHDSWWWIGVIVFTNLLIVRLSVSLVTLTVLGCLRLLRAVVPMRPAGGRHVQGERAMNPYVFHYRDVTFRIAYGYPSRSHLNYVIEAQRGEERSLGWVRYARLDLSGAQIECLEFFDNPQWLREVFSRTAGGVDPEGWTVSSARLPCCDLAVVLGEGPMEYLANWMAADYRNRFYGVIATIEAGCPEPPEYRLLWYWELCREVGINPCEEPAPVELAAAFRLVEAQATYEERQRAAVFRRQAKLLRMAQEKARHNAWVGEHLAEMVKTTVFDADLLRQGGDPVTFATSWYDVTTTYEPVILDTHGTIGYLEVCGETILAYVPQAFAVRWYRARWLGERGSMKALFVLNCMLRSGGKGIAGDDYMSWIFTSEGEDALVELARAGSPIEVPWPLVYLFAIASKFYRLPITVKLGEEHYVGYGVPGIHEGCEVDAGPLQGELWEQVLRLHGWILFGDEERGVWPCQADIAAHQLEVRRMCSGLPVLFS